jgi:hypothetical protein
LNASAELRPRELKVGAREARNDACRGKTNIGAIVAIADAVDHLRHVFLTETRVGAGIARFRA